MIDLENDDNKEQPQLLNHSTFFNPFMPDIHTNHYLLK